MMYENKRNGIKGELVQSQESQNGIKVYTLKLESGEEKAVFGPTFKRWWKKVEAEEQVEEVVDTEENLTDEDYAKIGVEIAEQAKKKSKKVKNKKAPRVDRSNDLLEIDSFIGDTYNNKYYSSVKCYKIVKDGKTVAEVYPRKKNIEVRVKTVKEDFDSDIQYKDGYKYYLPVHYFIEYSTDYIKLIQDLIG